MPPSLLAGFALGLSLIMAIGAQNAFVLRQGLRRQHVFWICLTCAGSDALLITAGVLGFGSVALAVPWFEQAMRWGGAAFLIWYGARALRAAWRGGETLDAAGEGHRQLHLLLHARLWRQPAGPGLCPPARLAGAGRPCRPHHVGDCAKAPVDVTNSPCARGPLTPALKRATFLLQPPTGGKDELEPGFGTAMPRCGQP